MSSFNNLEGKDIKAAALELYQQVRKIPNVHPKSKRRSPLSELIRKKYVDAQIRSVTIFCVILAKLADSNITFTHHSQRLLLPTKAPALLPLISSPFALEQPDLCSSQASHLL